MAKRTWIIEEATDEQGNLLGEFDRDEAAQLMQDLLGTLAAIGGMASFAARRRRVGSTPMGDTAESFELVVTWQAFSPMETAPVHVEEEAEPGDDPEEDLVEPGLMTAMADASA